MRKSFAKNASPMLAGVVKERTVNAVLAAIQNCTYHGATGIDLHLSCMDEDARTASALKKIVESSRLPILALNYNQTYDKLPAGMEEEERVGLMLKALEAGAAALDMQGYTFDAVSAKEFRREYAHLNYSFIQGNPKEVVLDSAVIDRQMALIEQVHGMGAEVLLSCHPGISMNCQQVVDLALFLEQRKPDIIKIVSICNTEEELVESFKTMITLKKEVKTRTTYHCAGQTGLLSRIINPVLGGYLIFCSDGYNEGSLLEQLDLQTAKTVLEGLKRIVGD